MANISVNPDDYSYDEFVRECKSAYIFYHLRKNNYDVTLTANKINTCRNLIHKLTTRNKKESEYNLNMSQSSFSPEFWNKKLKQIKSEAKISEAKKIITLLTEDELYNSMLPHYIYYINLKESEFDESDLVRLPLLIDHYKNINADDKVEDLTEILETIQTKINELRSI
ncbi:MAG: hypothetical protein ACOVSR_09780 [Bacteroidia bacterium]